eukprot:1540054-Rhodomonas_salina.3
MTRYVRVTMRKAGGRKQREGTKGGERTLGKRSRGRCGVRMLGRKSGWGGDKSAPCACGAPRALRGCPSAPHRAPLAPLVIAAPPPDNTNRRISISTSRCIPRAHTEMVLMVPGAFSRAGSVAPWSCLPSVSDAPPWSASASAPRAVGAP